jgi:hypothetical protein
MRVERMVLAGLLVLSLAPGVWAETLGEASERAREKGKDADSSARVFTNDDLTRDQPSPRPTPGDGAKANGDGAAATPTPPPAAAAEPGADSTAQREQWRQRSGAVDAEVEEAGHQVAEAQQRLDAAISPFNPLTPRGFGNPEVPALREALDKAKAALSAAEKRQAAFQEEARRAGIPAGWLQNR